MGLERLSTLLARVVGAEHQDQLDISYKSIDFVLRILHSILRDVVATKADTTVANARHALLDLLVVALQAIERQMTTEAEPPPPDGLVSARPGELLKTVVQLLTFSLGLPASENLSPATPRPDFGRLAVAYLRVMTVSGGLNLCASVGLTRQICPIGSNLEQAQALSDVLIYIIDCEPTFKIVANLSGAPAQSRSTVTSALLAEMANASGAKEVNLQDALPYSSPPSRPMGLTCTSLGDDDRSVNASLPLDDRPWEMLPQMASLPQRSRHSDLFLASCPLKDTASVPMSWFHSRLKRDPLPGPDYHVADLDETEDDPDTIWQNYASERNLGDGLAGEPIAAKQIATMLYAGPDDLDQKEIATDRSTRSPRFPLDFAWSPANSTPSILPRRASTRIAQASGSNRDPIPVDAGVGEDEDDSDELEIMEGPVAKRPRTASKSRPTTGGKAPAMKTVGGKSVARKATGGKTVKKTTGGKAPRGGRTKSNAD